MSKDNLNETDQILVHTARSILLITMLIMVCSTILLSVFLWNGQEKKNQNLVTDWYLLTDQQAAQNKRDHIAFPAGIDNADQGWKAPDENTIPDGKAGFG